MEENRLPDIFSNCIPESILNKADAIYAEYDSSFFQETQQDMAKHLLKLRVGFAENVRLEGLYRSDIKLLDHDLVI